MERPGKEPAVALDQHEAPETVQDTRWLNGINRQQRPDAAAAKRSANAMTRDESLAKKTKHKREVRMQKEGCREGRRRHRCSRRGDSSGSSRSGSGSCRNISALVPTLATFNSWCVQT